MSLRLSLLWGITSQITVYQQPTGASRGNLDRAFSPLESVVQDFCTLQNVDILSVGHLKCPAKTTAE